MADDNKILLKIQIEKGGSTVTLKNFENQVIKSGVAIKNLNNSIGNFTASKLKMNGQVKVTTDQFKRLEKSVGGFKTATGASTSATLELGRVLSDMPYGIRGVANNLQQLASNLFFMSKATDTATGKSVGFMGAIGNLFKGLIGPAGILIAFQGIIAAFDYFSNATDGAKKSTDEANVSIGVSATRLKALKDALDNGLMSRKEANEAVNAANKEFKELNLKLNENNKLTDDSVIAINSKIEALINLSKAQALQALLEKKYSELLPLQAKQLELDTKAKNENAKAIKAISTSYKENGTALAESSAKSSQAAADSNRAAVELIEKDITDLLKLGGEDGIIDLMFKGKETKNGKGKRPKAFTLFTPDSVEKQVKFAKKLIKKVAEAMGVELGKNPIDLNKLIDVELSDETKALIKKYNEDLKAEMALSDQLGDAQDFISKSQDILGGMTNFMNAQFEREMTIESNKTSALNEELNNRLLNENLSKDERVKIQNQIAINDEKLRKKQEKIAKKQFDMNKASNIASALMDTSAAAIGVMKDAKGGFFARLSQALPTIAFGLAQVATISRQKFQSSSANTPIRTTADSGGGGTTERADPSFNIVGRSGDNLLINAIQAQFDKPLKAYVVSRDITNQQQLDGMIVSQAGT
jgi:hypothetical protein